jgi:phage FluMu protein Com
MPVIACPGCNKQLTLKEEHAGRRIKCPQCSTVSMVPAAGPSKAPAQPASPAKAKSDDIARAIYGNRPALSDLAAAIREPDSAPGAADEFANGPQIDTGGDPFSAYAPHSTAPRRITVISPSPRGPAYAHRPAVSGAGRGGYVHRTNLRGGGQTSGMAVASLVLGIVGLVFGPLFGILALIFGFVSFGSMDKNPGSSGRGMAIAGIILGLVGLGLWILAFSMGLLSVAFTR